MVTAARMRFALGWALAGCAPSQPGPAPAPPEVADTDESGLEDTGSPCGHGAPNGLGWGYDHDGDGFAAGVREYACESPGQGWTTAGGDCDDGDARRHPGAAEVCDPHDVDEDCDWDADDDDRQGATDAPDWYPDLDGDGWGDTRQGRPSCDAPAGWIAASGDCADRDAERHPGAVDPCQTDGTDEDCDGAPPLYLDEDGDGFGTWPAACEQPATSASGDCDDADSGTNPGAREICGDGVDQDCDETALGCGFQGEWALADVALPQLAGGSVRGGDADRDGVADLLTVSRSGGLSLYLGPFDGTASTSAPAALVTSASSAARDGWLADLDGDGCDEVLADEPDASRSRLWADTGTRGGTIAAGSATHVLYGAFRIEAALDSDGDGADEIVAWTGRGGGYAAVVLDAARPGTWDAADLTVATLLDGTLPRSAGDVDGDGLADLAWSVDAGVAVAYGPVRGDLAGADADVLLAGFDARNQTEPSAAADLDGDGRGDLVVSVAGEVSTAPDECSGPPGAVFVLTSPLPSDLLDADATLSEPGLTALSGGAGDFDGDGSGDLVLVATTSCHGRVSDTFVVTGPFAGAMDVDDASAATILGPSYVSLPVGSVYAGALDGDGADDFALGAGESTRLFFGGPGF